MAELAGLGFDGGATDGEFEGEGLLDGIGVASGLDVGEAAVGVRRGSDFRAS